MKKIIVFLLIFSCAVNINAQHTVSKVVFSQVYTDTLFPLFPTIKIGLLKCGPCKVDYYELVMKGADKPILTVDTVGEMVINDSLAVIKTFLWYLKTQSEETTRLRNIIYTLSNKK